MPQSGLTSRDRRLRRSRTVGAETIVPLISPVPFYVCYYTDSLCYEEERLGHGCTKFDCHSSEWYRQKEREKERRRKKKKERGRIKQDQEERASRSRRNVASASLGRRLEKWPRVGFRVTRPSRRLSIRCHYHCLELRVPSICCRDVSTRSGIRCWENDEYRMVSTATRARSES